MTRQDLYSIVQVLAAWLVGATVLLIAAFRVNNLRGLPGGAVIKMAVIPAALAIVGFVILWISDFPH